MVNIDVWVANLAASDSEADQNRISLKRINFPLQEKSTVTTRLNLTNTTESSVISDYITPICCVNSMNRFDTKSLNETLISFLSATESSRYYKFKNPNSARNYLIARSILRILLSKYLSCHPTEIEFAQSEHGKPFINSSHHMSKASDIDFSNIFIESAYNNSSVKSDLPNYPCPPIHFNISHSANLIVLAFAPIPVGIDIERPDRQVDYNLLLKRYFSENEYRNWKTLCNSGEDPKKTFFRGWTRKEAFLKATGQGLSGLATVEIGFDSDDNKAILSYNDSKEAAEEWIFRNITPAENFIGSVSWHK